MKKTVQISTPKPLMQGSSGIKLHAQKFTRYLLMVALFMVFFAAKAKAQDPNTIVSITVSGLTGTYANSFNGLYVYHNGVYNGVPLFSKHGFYIYWDGSKWVIGNGNIIFTASSDGSATNFPTIGWSRASLSGYPAGLSGVPSFAVTVAAAAPTITSFTPTTAATGTTVTITGTNLTGATAVSFGGTAATSFTVVNATTITAVVGTGASGNVSVTTGGGTVSLAGFSFPNFVWTGATSTNWSDNTNWSNNVLPTQFDNVVIPAAPTNQPALTAFTAIGGIQLDGTLSLNNQFANLLRAVTGTGYIRGASNSVINIFGDVGTLSFDPSANSLFDFEVYNGSVTLGNALYLYDALVVYGGTLNTGGNLTLASAAGNIRATVYYPINGTINGNVTVQTYIPQHMGAAFRDLGVAVSGATVSTFNSSQVYAYPSTGWSSTLLSSTPLVPGVGYRTQVNTATGPVTLSATGTLVKGNVPATITQGSGAYSFVANPYCRVLDFTALSYTNLQDGYWYLDPTNLVPDALGNSYEGYVYYGTLTGASNTYAGGLTLNQYIQPSQGFFVQNQANASLSSLTFKENATLNGVNYSVFGTTAPLNKIATGLFKGGKNIDGAVAVFNSNFSSGMDKYDGAKFSNHGENITFVVAGKDLCANASANPTATDVLQMHLYNLVKGTAYTLKLDASLFVGNGVSAYIKDNVLHTQTLLSDSNTVSFKADSASYSSRFSIVFGTSPLAVKSISLTATQLQGTQVSVKWSVLGESNVVSYKVERSTNGSSFTSLATVSPSAGNYSYMDASSPSATAVYYRIKITDNLGVVSYSSVAKVATVNHLPLTIAPNPITNGTFKLGLSNTGNYTISLIDKLGKTVYSTTINHGTASTLESIVLGKKLAAGSYTVTATDATGKVASTEAIIQ